MGFLKKTFSICLILIFIFPGCSTSVKRLKCLNSIINNEKRSHDYLIVEQSLKDTIDSWISKKIEFTQNYKNNSWQLDAIIFNKQKNQCFIIFIDIDKNPDASLDYVHYGTGNSQRDTVWNFYFAGITNLVVPKSISKNNFEKMSMFAREELVKGGIVSKSDCAINDDYISAWFNQDLYKRHKKFLSNKSQ